VADKKLDDYVKDLQSYTVKVAAEKKRAQQEAEREPFYMPWKWVFLGLGILTWYFQKPIVTVGSQSNQPLPAQQQSNASASSTAAQAPEQKPTAVQSDYVKIDGRWFKRSADNTYMVNGRKVLYIDNRHQQGATPPAGSQ
jgi:hypothetical protein